MMTMMEMEMHMVTMMMMMGMMMVVITLMMMVTMILVMMMMMMMMIMVLMSRGEKGILAHPQRPPNFHELCIFSPFFLLKPTETKSLTQNPILRMRSSTTFPC